MTRKKPPTAKEKAKTSRAEKQRQVELKHGVIMKMYARGETYQAIAAEMKLAPASVRNLISRTLQENRLNVTNNLEEVRARELAKLDAVEREAWTEWERSKQDARQAERITTEGGADGIQTTLKRKRAGRLADPRYLKVIVDTISTRADLLGLKLEHVDVTSAGQSIGASVAGGMMSLFQHMASVEKAAQQTGADNGQGKYQLESGESDAGTDDSSPA